MKMMTFAALSLLAPLATSLSAQQLDQVVELGQIHWGRDHSAAFERAVQAHMPVLLLFQEIPG